MLSSARRPPLEATGRACPERLAAEKPTEAVDSRQLGEQSRARREASFCQGRRSSNARAGWSRRRMHGSLRRCAVPVESAPVMIRNGAKLRWRTSVTERAPSVRSARRTAAQLRAWSAPSGLPRLPTMAPLAGSPRSPSRPRRAASLRRRDCSFSARSQLPRLLTLQIELQQKGRDA